MVEYRFYPAMLRAMDASHAARPVMIEGENVSCYAPIATMILLSIVLTIVLNIVIRLLNR